jgi:lipid-binding SYLF domain-containing protein
MSRDDRTDNVFHADLVQDVKSYCKLLHDLTKKEASKRPQGTEPLPEKALAAISGGLAFLDTWKMGFGLGITRGRGLLINRLAPDAGPAASKGWSAPVFIHLEGLSAGLTVGWNTVHSVLILEKQDPMNRLAKEKQELTIAPEFNLNVPIVFQYHSNQGNNVDYRHGTSLKYSREYSMADGFLGDISFRAGYYKVHEDMNKYYYGNDITVDAILEGKVKPPLELAPLYEELAKHVKD